MLASIMPRPPAKTRAETATWFQSRKQHFDSTPEGHPDSSQEFALLTPGKLSGEKNPERAKENIDFKGLSPPARPCLIKHLTMGSLRLPLAIF
jgi:hypothetical protein